MAVYTYTGNRESSEKTSEIRLRGGTLILRPGQYADLTDPEYAALRERYILTPGVATGAVVASGQGLRDLLSPVAVAQLKDELSLEGATVPEELLITGNSYAHGGGTGLSRATRFGRVAADALGAEEFNYAKDGAVLYRSTDNAGWRGTLKRIMPAYNQTPPNAVVPRFQGPYLPAVQCAVLCRNMNDQMVLGAEQRPFIQSLLSEITRMRAANVYRGDATNWTTAAGVTLSNDTGVTDGKWLWHATGQWAERQTAADWPGGTGFFQVVTGDANFGGVVDILVDGVVVKTVDLTAFHVLTPGYFWPVTMRFNIPAGVHTVRYRQTSGAGALNTFGLGAPSPPLVVPMLGHRLRPEGVAQYGATAANDLTLEQNRLVREMVATEFPDGRVQPFDMDAVMGLVAENYAADNLHPSELGHARMGAALASHIRRYFGPWRECPKLPPRWHLVSDPDGFSPAVFTASGYNQTFYGVPPNFDRPRVRRERNNDVVWAGLVGLGGAGALIQAEDGLRPPTAWAVISQGTDAAGAAVTGPILMSADGGIRTQAPIALGATNPYAKLEGLRYKAAI